MNTRIIVAAAALALATGGNAGAAAPDAPQIAIDTSSFDLGTADGQSRLDRTMRDAARKVCAADSMRDMLEVKRLERACMVAALGSARQQVAMITDKVASGRNTMAALSTPRDLGSQKH